jgi:predicted naringenin-chalcone synthase
MMFLDSIATASPAHAYTQLECYAALSATEAFAGLRPRSQALLSKVLGSDASGIATRNLCLADIGPVVGHGPQALNESFEREAPVLASAALSAALENAGLQASDLDALFICITSPFTRCSMMVRMRGGAEGGASESALVVHQQKFALGRHSAAPAATPLATISLPFEASAVVESGSGGSRSPAQLTAPHLPPSST